MKDLGGLTFYLFLVLAGWAQGANVDSHAKERSAVLPSGGQSADARGEAKDQGKSTRYAYEFLTEFSSSTVPIEVATADKANNDTWDAYGLRVMANGAWKVEKGEYTPGYKTAKGDMRARLVVGKVQKTDWKNDYAWVLFTDPMFGKGFLYQAPAQGGRRAAVRHLPFKYGERGVVWPELAELGPYMLDAFTSLRCLEVWVRIGDPEDCSEKIRAADAPVVFSGQGVDVNYQDRDVEAGLEALKSSQNTVANGYCQLRDEILKSAEALEKVKMNKRIMENELIKSNNATDPAVLQKEIIKLQSEIAVGAETIRELRTGRTSARSEIFRLEAQLGLLRDELFERQNALKKSSALRKQNEITRLKKQAELEKAEQAIAQLDLRMAELLRRKTDMLGSLKGKLPMTATVVVDAPAKTKDKQ